MPADAPPTEPPPAAQPDLSAPEAERHDGLEQVNESLRDGLSGGPGALTTALAGAGFGVVAGDLPGLLLGALAGFIIGLWGFRRQRPSEPPSTEP